MIPSLFQEFDGTNGVADFRCRVTLIGPVEL
jgi:hypothetical protein